MKKSEFKKQEGHHGPESLTIDDSVTTDYYAKLSFQANYHSPSP